MVCQEKERARNYRAGCDGTGVVGDDTMGSLIGCELSSDKKRPVQLSGIERMGASHEMCTVFWKLICTQGRIRTHCDLGNVYLL